MEEGLQSCRRKAENHKIERWNREQGWENLHNEDGEKHRSKEEQENTGECANGRCHQCGQVQPRPRLRS